MSIRLVSGLALALGVLSATSVSLQARESGTSGTSVDDLVIAGQPQYVSAEIRATAPITRSADRRTSAVPEIDPGWVTRTARAAGIPVPAVRAYARAQLAAPAACGIGWTTLAGIGWVESQHGTIGGRTLGEDGHSSSPILGPALDGTGKVAAIPATPESTTWHGDPRWDHAVGPLQFIPSTWATWASDGDGDGVADPNDLDDAAYAAARYLCADGRDLTSSTGWQQAIFSYNHARSYVDSVYAAATAYAARVS